MVELFYERLSDARFMTTLFTVVAVIATIYTLAMPFISGDGLDRRMKTLAVERGQIRAREREKLARGEKVNLRPTPKAFMQNVVESLDLKKWLGEDEAKAMLVQAGFRGQGPQVSFLFFRMVAPIGMLIFAALYLFVLVPINQSPMVKIGMCIAAAYLGIKLPQLFLRNVITRRQQSVRRAFPDALDLLLICVESGMSIDAAFKRVSQEVGSQSVPLAEELTLTTAELSYLQDRRMAFENLAARTGIDGVKAVCTALIQAERYGTPLAQALRVLAQEIRDQRMSEAEKKAAALPPKLTVPMILFFLPVLFIVIMGPAAIRVMEIK
ncbi:MAG: type II secretion system F family protein [Rhizobiales bacterium]|jgi:tight adherence protein C|nr:type II secretion system F family protein [Hyphomicrobiales bacterium]